MIFLIVFYCTFWAAWLFNRYLNHEYEMKLLDKKPPRERQVVKHVVGYNEMKFPPATMRKP